MSALIPRMLSILLEHDPPTPAQADDPIVAESSAPAVFLEYARLLGKPRLRSLLEELLEADWEHESSPTLPAPPPAIG